MYCTKCGAQIPKGANFCHNCGEDVQAPAAAHNAASQKPIKKKPGCFARLLKTGSILFVALILCGVLFGDDTSNTQTPGTSSTPKATVKPRVTATSKPTATPKPTNTPKPTEKPFGKEDVELMKTFLSTALQKSYSWYDIQGDETGFTINVANDGGAQAVARYKSLGKGADSEDWVIVKDSFVELYNLVYQSLETFGMKDPSLMMSIVNDRNHDNYLLIVGEGGTIIYDVLAE